MTAWLPDLHVFRDWQSEWLSASIPSTRVATDATEQSEAFDAQSGPEGVNTTAYGIIHKMENTMWGRQTAVREARGVGVQG